MKHHLLPLLLIAAASCGQPAGNGTTGLLQGPGADAGLIRQIEESGQVHRIMHEIPGRSGMERWLEKPVLDSRELPLVEDFASLRHTGPGTISPDYAVTRSGKGSVHLDAPASLAKKSPDNRNYGMPDIIRPLDGEDLREWNRFSCWVYVDAPGYYLVFLGFTLFNEGEKPMPTPGRFEGQHFVTVRPGEWTRIVWEIPDLYRDKVTGFGASMMMNGETAGASDRMHLYVEDMRLEKVDPEHSRGFALKQGTMAYSHCGYLPGHRKQALVPDTGTDAFQLTDAASGATVYKGRGTSGEYGLTLLDFSDFDKPGRYIIRCGDTASQPFPIGTEAYAGSLWHSLNFYFSERCGFDQPGIHQECHQDVFLHHPDGRSMSIAGGWHDAADLTQGTGNTAESGIALLEAADVVKGRDPLLYERLLEEARWGLNWVLRTRFGDGYRAGGLIIGIWTQNIRGDKDDMDGMASDRAADNFRSAEYAALAVPHFEATDPVFARWCRVAAEEDFAFALRRLDGQLREENTTELSAMAVTAAMRLYRLTQDRKYLDVAVERARTVMAGQQAGRRTEWARPLHGFFFEGPSHQRILAYYHQSQEHRPAQGLSMLLAAAPDHPEAAAWRAALAAAGDWYRETADVMAPYGILPAAIYETDNTDYSNLYHEGERVGLPTMSEFNAQVRNGIPLGGGFYLRRFPVAYQFRGFNGVTLAKAKACFILAEALHDEGLFDIAARQVEYVLGFNPFALSTVYGEGYGYPLLYGAYAGNVVGAVPVGMETFENEDEPYFPMQSNCTYKEIWTHSTARLTSCVAELLKAGLH